MIFVCVYLLLLSGGFVFVLGESLYVALAGLGLAVETRLKFRDLSASSHEWSYSYHPATKVLALNSIYTVQQEEEKEEEEEKEKEKEEK